MLGLNGAKLSIYYAKLLLGSSNFFLTTTDNMKQFFQPQAFEHIQLLKTIKQAIALTSALGEQYLWVDALCVVQNGPDKFDHLNAMASLYANSTLTIVAGQNGHADAASEVWMESPSLDWLSRK